MKTLISNTFDLLTRNSVVQHPLLADLAKRMAETLPRDAKASYWQADTEAGDPIVARVYVTRNGKKAGFVTMADDKASYNECVAPDLIAAFRTARKAQKEAK